jgi:NitT/TauT family transport system substrate-binding protein
MVSMDLSLVCSHARSRVLAKARVLLAASLALSVAGALGAERQKVRIAVGSRPGNIVYLHIDLARALGYFEQEGLDASFRYFEGGTPAAEALASREYDVSANSIDHAITLRASGQQLQMVASFTDLPCVTLVVRKDLRPQIRSERDLKGRRIGVTAIGAGTHVLAASILHHAGYTLRDVEIVPVSSGDLFIAAMAQKRIDVGMATDPTTTRLLLSGEASILLDMTTRDETSLIFDGPYQFTGLLTRPDVIRDHPALVQAVVNAMVKAARYIRTHNAAEITGNLPPAIVGDRYIYVKSLEHSRPGFARDAAITPAAVANNIQSQITFGFDLPASSRDPAIFINDRFVRTAR